MEDSDTAGWLVADIDIILRMYCVRDTHTDTQIPVASPQCAEWSQRYGVLMSDVIVSMFHRFGPPCPSLGLTEVS